jgi:hypothetical protein
VDPISANVIDVKKSIGFLNVGTSDPCSHVCTSLTANIEITPQL